MKYSKRYIAFTFILALIFVSNFYIYAKDSSTLGAFRGAQIDNTCLLYTSDAADE